MTPGTYPICLGCKYFKPQPARENGLTCAAFPVGIPDAIINSQEDHRKPYPGDSGIRFEPKDDKAAQYAESVFSK